MTSWSKLSDPAMDYLIILGYGIILWSHLLKQTKLLDIQLCYKDQTLSEFFQLEKTERHLFDCTKQWVISNSVNTVNTYWNNFLHFSSSLMNPMHPHPNTTPPTPTHTEAHPQIHTYYDYCPKRLLGCIKIQRCRIYYFIISENLSLCILIRYMCSNWSPLWAVRA